MTKRQVTSFWGLAVAVALSSCVALGLASPRPPRFFVSGDGTLAISNAHFEDRIGVRYRNQSNTYDSEALEQIKHLFRSRDGKEGDVSLRLVELLAYIQREFKPSAMVLVSGYRSPEYNATLKGAADSSMHTQGMAADVMFPGTDLVALWKALREKRVGGVGLYKEDGYLHIDTGPPRFWEKQTSRVGEHLSAGNARAFARTYFDIHEGWGTVSLTLHSVTLFPLRISRRAQLAGFPDAVVTLGHWYGEGDKECMEIDERSAHFPIDVGGVENKPMPGKRTRILLSTCEPRLGQTPATIETNEIEVLR